MNKWLQALSRRTKGEKGVTLIELLAVIVIIAVIAAIAVPVVLGAIKNSKTNTAKQDMTVIAEALNRYAFDNNGQFPSSSNAWQPASTFLANYLPVSGSANSGSTSNTLSGTSGYLQGIPKDPWGNDFYYWSDGNNFELETAAAHDNTKPGDKLYMSNKMSAPDSSTGSDTTHNW